MINGGNLTMQPFQIDIQETTLEIFCERNHITRMAFYGSVLRDDFHADSDVDVLIGFDPDHVPGWEIVGIIDELHHLLGREVDVTTFDAIHPLLRDKILASMRTVYERA